MESTGTWRETVARFGGRSHWLDLDGPLHYVEFGPETARAAAPGAATESAAEGAAEGAAEPPVVLVHGLGGSFVEWLALAPLLSRDRRVLALDLPGHGLTPASGRRPRLADLQGLLNRFLLATGLQRPLVVGNSLGGALAALHASAWPRATSGAVLVDPVLPIGPRMRPHPLVVAGFAAYATPGLGRRVLDRRRMLVSPDLLTQETLAFVCADPGRIPPEVVAAGVQMAAHRRLWPPDDAAFLAVARDILRRLARPAAYTDMLATVEAPVLLIHGDEDRFVPVTAAQRAVGRLTTWQHAIIAGAGHLPQLEAAPDVAALIRGWQSGSAVASPRA